MTGSIGGVIVIGILTNDESDAYKVKYAYMSCIFAAIPVLMYLAGYPSVVFDRDNVVSTDSKRELLDEEREADRHSVVRFEPSIRECKLVGIVVMSAVLFLALLFNISPGNVYMSFTAAMVLSAVVLGYTTYVYKDNPMLYGICIFSFTHEVLYVDISGAMDVFYTAPAPCLYGPDFDLMFYIGWTRIIGHTIAVVVIVVYTQWFQKWSPRSAIMMGISFRVYSSLTDIVIGKRWNVSVGISDASCYILGDAMISPAASTFVQLALILATTKALVRGKETLTQAIVTSLQAMGQSVSGIVGITLIHTFKVTADLQTNACDYDNYVPLLIVAHVVVPAFLFPLAFMTLN